MQQNPIPRDWEALARMNASPALAADVMNCKISDAKKRLRQARYRIDAAVSVAAHQNERDTTEIIAKACGLRCVDMPVSDAAPKDNAHARRDLNLLDQIERIGIPALQQRGKHALRWEVTLIEPTQLSRVAQTPDN